VGSNNDSAPRGDEAMNEVLRRMLNTPPKPHKEKGGEVQPRRQVKKKTISSSKASKEKEF
jgi:hypothetical protein